MKLPLRPHGMQRQASDRWPANQPVQEGLSLPELACRGHAIALSYLSSFVAQMVVYLYVVTQADQRMSPNFIFFSALICSLLSVIPGSIAVLPQRLTGFGAIILGALVGLAMLFGFIYIPRLLFPEVLSFG